LPQALLFRPVGGDGRLDAQVEQRSPVRQFRNRVAAAGRPDHELPRHRPVAGMQRQGLFGRETPGRPETLFQMSNYFRVS
jgi:hypothetical protein